MLKNSPIFADLDAESLAALGKGATIKVYDKNTHILTQGDATSSLYIILEGRVKVFVANEDGKEITLDFLSAGEAFGELALLDGEKRSANVMTTEQSKIATLSQQVFLDCMRQNSNIAVSLLRVLASRVRSLTMQVESLALLDVYGRVARELIRQSEETADGQRITPAMTHQDLANLVGASREMVTKILLDLKRGGYIKIDNHRIVIRNRLPANW